MCGSAALREYLVNHARPFIYSTGLAPAAAGAALAGIKLLSGNADRVKQLRENISNFKFRISKSPSPIIPLVIPGNTAVLKAQAKLKDKGFWVPAMRYPTVKKGSERLRISLRADHTIGQLQGLAQALDVHI